MATTFFSSWALWEKMTFVLILAIIAVFGIGYGKLVWRNRLVKKQEGKDEEQRIAVEELRASGQMVETRKSQDIPFGVRAIQSGIQIDGIWISKDSTPIPAGLIREQPRSSSSDHTRSQSPSPRESIDGSQTAVQSSSRGRSIMRQSELGILSAGQYSRPTETQDSRGKRPSYKPRRSSHLRYDSHGETNYNEETLDQLEGKARAERSSCASKPLERLETEGYTSAGPAAENERSSGSEIDVTLSRDPKMRAHGERQSLPVHLTKGSSSRPPQASLPPQTSMAEHFLIPVEPADLEKLDPFATPQRNSPENPLPFKPPYARTARELTASGESQVPLLAHSRSPSPFIPGELHMNKSIRKVNSGFEVLPAGTFGVPAEFKGTGADREDRWNPDGDSGEKKYSNKLQKKTRTSISSRRPSSNFESP